MQALIDYPALGERVRQARNKIGLTQAQLAELCDLSTSHIGHIERGTRVLSLEVLFKISVALKTSTDYFVYDSVSYDCRAFSAIESILKTKDKNKVKRYMVAIKALLDKIDEF